MAMAARKPRAPMAIDSETGLVAAAATIGGIFIREVFSFFGIKRQGLSDAARAQIEAEAEVEKAEIEERAKFRADLLARVDVAEKRADEAVKAAHRGQLEIVKFGEINGELKVENAALRLQVTEREALRLRVKELEDAQVVWKGAIADLTARLAAHERNCPRKPKRKPRARR